METAKKTYHMACKEEKLAATREANGKTEASVTVDQQKKLHEKVDKCKQDAQKVRERKRENQFISQTMDQRVVCIGSVLSTPEGSVHWQCTKYTRDRKSVV